MYCIVFDPVSSSFKAVYPSIAGPVAPPIKVPVTLPLPLTRIDNPFTFVYPSSEAIVYVREIKLEIWDSNRMTRSRRTLMAS